MITHTDPLFQLRAAFPEFDSSIQNKRILDYGCGVGQQAIALVLAGAQHLTGIDTDANAIAQAHANASRAGIESRVRFTTAPLDDLPNNFDCVISHNAMEHYGDPVQVVKEMSQVLFPHGFLYITFGPPWYAPYGSHMKFVTRIPWIHLIMSESAVMRIRARHRNDGARRYADVEGGLNRMSVQRFDSMVASLGLT